MYFVLIPSLAMVGLAVILWRQTLTRPDTWTDNPPMGRKPRD